MDKLFKEYENINVTFDELKNKTFSKNKKLKLNVTKDGILFEFLLFFKDTSKKVAVLGSGAFDRNKMQPPVFHRHKWFGDFDESVIIFNDPTLSLGDINIGWGYGNQERHFISEIGDILKIIYQCLGIKTTSALYFGSSAGGFTAMMLASYMKGWAFVNNPQTDIRLYFKTHVDKLKCVVYGDENIELINIRSNVVEWFKKNKYVPRIYYAQNLTCSHDMNKHFLPFLDQVRHIDERYFKGKLTTHLYADKERGHDPLEKRETLGIMRNIFKLVK